MCCTDTVRILKRGNVMSPKKNQSDSFTVGVDEIFRITSHIQGRMSLYLAEAGVLEERAHRDPSDGEKQVLQDELTSLDVILHQLNDVTEIWDALESKEIKRKFTEELAKVIRQYLEKTETRQKEGARKPKKYMTVLTEPKIETSIEYLMRRIKEER